MYEGVGAHVTDLGLAQHSEPCLQRNLAERTGNGFRESQSGGRHGEKSTPPWWFVKTVDKPQAVG